MPETFQEKLDAVTDRQDYNAADGDLLAQIDMGNLQVRSWRALTRVRTTSDVSEWIFVGRAVRIDLIVTRNADSADEFETGRIGLYGLNGKDKPAASEAGLLLVRTDAGENQLARLHLINDYTRPIPMWLKVAVQTDGSAGDFADATVKIVEGAY